MIRHLTISAPAFRTLADRLAVSSDRVLHCRAGLNRLADRLEWLVAGADQPSAGADAPPQVVFTASPVVAELRGALARALARAARGSAGLALGIGPSAGHLAAAVQEARGLEPLDALTVLGPGLPQVRWSAAKEPGLPALAVRTEAAPELSPEEVWSRTIGALGEAAWRRLTTLRFGIVGCGRSGSLVAAGLLRLGVSTEQVTLIDGDTLSSHNVGESGGATARDLGRFKVHALADFLRGQAPLPGEGPTAIADSVLSLAALAAVKAVDVLFCCVDNASARLATAFLATVYLKPLFDIGTGIFHGNPAAGTRRRMGLDVRMLLNRCLLCHGGVAGLEAARAELLALSPTLPPDPDAWRRQRAGSLYSLNLRAVSFSLGLLESVVEGRLGGSLWLHMDVDETGIPALERRTPPANPRCPLCALAGTGDSAVGGFRTFLRQLDTRT